MEYFEEALVGGCVCGMRGYSISDKWISGKECDRSITFDIIRVLYLSPIWGDGIVESGCGQLLGID
jgi:hypothetical protein